MWHPSGLQWTLIWTTFGLAFWISITDLDQTAVFWVIVAGALVVWFLEGRRSMRLAIRESEQHPDVTEPVADFNATQRMKKRDDVIWLRHLRDAGIDVPVGTSVLFRINGREVEFEPMRAGKDGRPTLGLRATGALRRVWLDIPKGDSYDFELIQVLEGARAAWPERVAPNSEGDSRVGSQDTHDLVTGETSDLAFAVVKLPLERTPDFDAYLMVDWSASSKPVSGKNSVWWYLCAWQDGQLWYVDSNNPPTRQACFEEVRVKFVEFMGDGKSVLVGFDFAFGYPSSLAEALQLPGSPWRAVWDEVRSQIHDDQDGGTNNRFEVANKLNQRVSASEGPFWGFPQHRSFDHLGPTQPSYPVSGMERLRLTEECAAGVKPVWQLWGQGSVGSQTLLGIPHLANLRHDPDLSGLSAVWPFETGCTLPPSGGAPRIVFAEIYPSMVRLPSDLGGRVKDEVQVELVARWLAQHDAVSTLGSLFTAPGNLAPEQTERVLDEEGWILGVRSR